MGNWRVRNPNIRGIIHSIMLLVWACLVSVVGMVIIFCWTHMEPPTRMGSKKGILSAWAEPARSIHRKLLFTGTALLTRGSQEYRCWASPARDSGVLGMRRIID